MHLIFKNVLRSILAVIGLVAVITGALGVQAGVMDEFYGISVSQHPGHIILDSNLRYFSGLWLGLGLIMFWMIPSIETHKILFRLMAGMIFIGGVGRVISMFAIGLPSIPFVIFTGLELAFPLLIILQKRIIVKDTNI